MSINIGPPSVDELRPRITVIGVGGAGGNAIANMIESEIDGVDFIVANTDAQALNNAVAEHRIQLGPDITAGLGAGSRPEVGRAAAEETEAEIERALEGVNMVFIAAGMGGGTGTGAAPVIAEVARKKGILTVGVVTKPFLFEGSRRMRAAEAGIDELQKHVDTLIVIPNQNLFLVAKAETTFKEAFQLADEVLQQGVRSITDLMVMPGLINLDFADVRSVMNEMGKAMMGTGEGEGENRALEAAERAIANPLLDGVSMQGAKGVIISIIGGEDMKLLEVDEAANHIRELVDPEANIIWGSAFNPNLNGKLRVSVVATGIEQSAEQMQAASRPIDLGAARGPKKPVLPLAASEPEAAPAPAAPEPEAAVEESSLPEPADDTTFGAAGDDGFGGEDDTLDDLDAFDDDDDDMLDLTEADETLELGDSELAGSGMPEVSNDDGDDDFAAGDGAGDGEGGNSGDELLLDATRLADAGEPVEPAGDDGGIFGGGTSGGGASGGGEAGASGGAAAPEPSTSGSTLFERMANLSRNAGEGSKSAEDEDEDDDDGGAIRIPRFLGRQNNQ